MEAPLAERIRPQKLEEYISQSHLVGPNGSLTQQILKGIIPSLIFWGPPGTGKTTLAQIIAQESKRPFYTLSAINSGVKDIRDVIEKAKQSGGLFTTKNPILFIDEIHRLSPVVEEILYPAMEDYRLDIIIGSGPAAQTVKIDLPRFTLIGATTRAGMLSNPLRERFGMHFRMQFYTEEELAKIIQKASIKLGIECEDDSSLEMSKRSRGTPRVALRLLRRVRDFSQVKGEKTILLNTCKYALDELGINENGFDEMDINLLELLISNRGRPMGLGTMAAALSEDEGTIEDAIEPYLLANGYIERTARGRVASVKTYEMFRLTPPQNKLDENNQGSLF